MTSRELKAAVYQWLSFKRGNYLVATEVNYDRYVADLLAFDGKEFTEVEIKRSYSDFVKDFEKTHKYRHTSKHDFDADKYGFIPNRFYFAMESKLAQKALLYIDEHGYKKVGVVAIESITSLAVIRNATLIREANPNLYKPAQKWIALRMRSELANLMLDRVKLSVTSNLDDIGSCKDQVVDSVDPYIGDDFVI